MCDEWVRRWAPASRKLPGGEGELSTGEEKRFWVFTKVVRLKRYGRKRLVIGHEHEDLTDAPRFLLTDAVHWESGRVIQTWSYRSRFRGLS
jgi:hypothetical protein